MRPWLLVSTVIAVTGVAATIAATATPAENPVTQTLHEPISPLDPPPPLDPEKVALGAKLFADPILSSKNKLACTSCHDITAGGTVSEKRTIGYNGKMHQFNAPTIFNVANNYRFGWRGNFTSLEEQNETVLLDSNLMDNEWDTLLAKLRAAKPYASEFRSIYGRNVDRVSLLDALVTFQRSLVTPNSRFDRYLRGEVAALTPKEAEGYYLFKRYGCSSCHQGSNIGGNMFQKFGIFAEPNGGPVNTADLGRWTITGAARDKGVFRVPSLRNVAVTAPYFHDGRAATLSEAVKVMARSQVGQEMPNDDVSSIVAFLKTLTGEYNGRPLHALPPVPDNATVPGDNHAPPDKK